jgi:hypothetical protein
VFREYRNGTQFLRIGERWEWGGSNSGKNFNVAPVCPGDNCTSHQIDLTDAVRAEVEVSKVQCHTGTTGLRISLNNNEYIPLPVSDKIPSPPQNYQFWEYNVFRMRVDADPKPSGQGGWMQNLIYGVHLRIYYDAAKKAHPTGSITNPSSGGTVGRDPTLESDAASPGSTVETVEFVGLYEDFDYEGNGVYREWHYNYTKSDRTRHLGTSSDSPWQITWDNSWVPEQPHPMKIAAFVTDADNTTYMTEAVDNITLARSGFTVEMCKPYNVPAGWVTRKSPQSENFDVTMDLSKATASKCFFSKWGGHNGKGVTINGTHLPGFVVNMSIPVSCLKAGKNTLTPDGNVNPGHHGMEINWPGVVVFIQGSGPVTSTSRDIRKHASSSTGPVVSRVSGAYRIAFGAGSMRRATVYDISGRRVMRFDAIGAAYLDIPARALSKGYHVVRVRTEQGTGQMGFVVR